MSITNVLNDDLGYGIEKLLCVKFDDADAYLEPTYTVFVAVRGRMVDIAVHTDIRKAKVAYDMLNTCEDVLDAFISNRISSKLESIQKLPSIVGQQEILDACEAVCGLNNKGRPYLKCSPSRRKVGVVPVVSDSLSTALAQFEEHDYYDTDYKELWNPVIKAKYHKRKVCCRDFCDKIYLVPLIGVYVTMLWAIDLNATKPVYNTIVAGLWQIVCAIRDQNLLKENVNIRVGHTHGSRSVMQVPPTLTEAEIEKQRRAKCAELCYDYEKLYRKHTKE